MTSYNLHADHFAKIFWTRHRWRSPFIARNNSSNGNHCAKSPFALAQWPKQRNLIIIKPLPQAGKHCARRPIANVYTKVTDEGLKELSGLKRLQSLDLTGNQVTDEGLKEVARLKNMQSLNLSLTGVTDAGLKELRGLKNLRKLDLYAVSQVTEGGLQELAGLKMQSLDLRGTGVRFITPLEMQWPRCQIYQGPQ